MYIFSWQSRGKGCIILIPRGGVLERKNMAKEKYNITGMSCAACSAKVERVVGKLDGVENVSVNLLTNSMQVEYKEDKLSSNDIIKNIADAGYGASLATATKQKKEEKSIKKTNDDAITSMKFRLKVSIVFLAICDIFNIFALKYCLQ